MPISEMLYNMPRWSVDVMNREVVVQTLLLC